MAINKKLIHFNKKADFQLELEAGNILDKSIIFIKDSDLIYTHGKFYDCALPNWEAEEGESGYIENKPFYSNGFTENFKEIVNKLNVTLSTQNATQPEDNSFTNYVSVFYFGSKIKDYLNLNYLDYSEIEPYILSTDPNFWNDITLANTIKITVGKKEFICYVNQLENASEGNYGLVVISDINKKIDASKLEDVEFLFNEANIYICAYNNYPQAGCGMVASFVVKYPYTAEAPDIQEPITISPYLSYEDIKQVEAKYLPIVQESGTSETSVMSLKAVTDYVSSFNKEDIVRTMGTEDTIKFFCSAYTNLTYIVYAMMANDNGKYINFTKFKEEEGFNADEYDELISKMKEGKDISLKVKVATEEGNEYTELKLYYVSGISAGEIMNDILYKYSWSCYSDALYSMEAQLFLTNINGKETLIATPTSFIKNEIEA